MPFKVFVEGGGAAIPTGRIARTGGGDGRQGREATRQIKVLHCHFVLELEAELEAVQAN